MKKCLVIVDVQNDFVSGTLGFDGADRVVEVIVEKLKHHQGDVVFTRDTHHEDYLNTQEGTRLPIEHCFENTEGWQLDARLLPFVGAETVVFNKPSFGSLELIPYFQEHQYDCVEIAGLVSNICVISTAVLVKTADPEVRIVVDRQATDSFDASLNEKTFAVLEGLQVDVFGGVDEN